VLDDMLIQTDIYIHVLGDTEGSVQFLVHQNIWFVRICVTVFLIFVTPYNIRRGL
jgi:hypothetical protein